jgi:hypothetical protein
MDLRLGWESCDSIVQYPPTNFVGRDKCDDSEYDEGWECRDRRLIGETFSIRQYTQDPGGIQSPLWMFEQQYRSYSCKKWSVLTGDHTISYDVDVYATLIVNRFGQLATVNLGWQWQGVTPTTDDTYVLIWQNEIAYEADGIVQQNGFSYAYNGGEMNFHYKKRGVNPCTPDNMKVKYSLP